MGIETEGARVINGGLVTGLPPHAIGAGESPDANEIDPSYPIGCRVRPGSTQFGVTGPAAGSGTILGGLKSWTRDAGTAWIFVANATTIYAVDTGSWFSVRTGMATDSIMQAAALNNMLVVVASGLRPQISSAGSSLASVAAGTYLPSQGKYITEYVSKLWIGGDTTDPSTVSFCKSQDPDDWSTASNAGSVTVGKGDGDTLRGVEGTRKALYFFKRKNTYVLTGTTVANFNVDLLCTFGLVSEYGKATDGQGVFFASDDGIYYAVGLNIARISDAVKGTYDAISDKTTIAMEVKGEKLFVFYKASGSQNNQALVCAFKRKMDDGGVRGVWSIYTSHKYSVANTSRANNLYVGTNASSLQIYELDTGAVGAVAAYWNTPDMDFQNYSPKTLMRYFVHMSPDTATTTVTVRHYADGASVGSDITMTFGTVGSHSVQMGVPAAAVTGRYLRLKFSWTGSKTIYGYQVFADIRSDGIPRR